MLRTDFSLVRRNIFLTSVRKCENRTKNRETLFYIYRVILIFIFQQLAMSNSSLPLTHKCAVHGMVAAYLNLASQLLCEQPVCQYVSEEKDSKYSVIIWLFLL